MLDILCQRIEVVHQKDEQAQCTREDTKKEGKPQDGASKTARLKWIIQMAQKSVADSVCADMPGAAAASEALADTDTEAAPLDTAGFHHDIAVVHHRLGARRGRGYWCPEARPACDLQA